jgi:uncharacterized sulfatase
MLRSFLLLLALSIGVAAADTPRPNILWLVNEDHGPDLGCYGDTYATTPTADALAAKGIRYARCWSNAPVCAPARTTLICGMYANSTGGEHMRSMVPFPAGKKMYPQLLREAGYYCTNNAKEDYNLSKPGDVWNDSSKKGHWRNRPAGAPFMAVFNSEKSHESQIRKKPHTLIHDPAKVRVPALHPDTPEVRHDWAQYYDGVSAADADAGARLKQLEEDGLTEDTIVFYYADHGSGMPGYKRWPVNRGLQTPLIIYIPEKFASLRPPEYKPGGVSDRLVSFVDFAPTLCSLAGVKPPEWIQGHAFLGPYAAALQPFLYGFRGRMDERVDCVRSVTDGRYVYARNFRPDLIYGQHLDYMWQTPTTPVWERLFHEGKLTPEQAFFWKPKPPEELYDLQTDRDEVHNLATDPAHRTELEKLRTALREHEAQIRDVGLLPEGEMHRRSAGSTPYDFAHNDSKYPFSRIYATADQAASLDPAATPALVKALADPDSGVRVWGALGLLMRKKEGVASGHDALVKALDDKSPDVRFTAAEALGRFGSDADLQRILPLLAAGADPAKNEFFTAMAALTAITDLGEKAAPIAATVQGFSDKAKVPDPRFAPYIPRLLEDLKASLARTSAR